MVTRLLRVTWASLRQKSNCLIRTKTSRTRQRKLRVGNIPTYSTLIPHYSRNEHQCSLSTRKMEENDTKFKYIKSRLALGHFMYFLNLEVL